MLDNSTKEQLPLGSNCECDTCTVVVVAMDGQLTILNTPCRYWNTKSLLTSSRAIDE